MACQSESGENRPAHLIPAHLQPAHFAPKYLASSAQAGFGAQNAAQAAAQSSAGSAVTGATAPIAPATSAPSYWSSTTEPQLRGLTSPSSSSSSASSFASPASSASASSSASYPSTPSSATGKGSIESYFQLSGSRSSVPPEVRSRPDDATKKKFSPGKALWHILDNAGVPMFGGNTDADIDPRITRSYIDPPLPNLNSKVGKASDDTIDTSKLHTISSDKDPGYAIQGTPHKIPEGQLEGTDLPIRTDTMRNAQPSP